MINSPLEKEKVLNSLESIANSLKRIADALEKATSENNQSKEPLDPDLPDESDVLKSRGALEKR